MALHSNQRRYSARQSRRTSQRLDQSNIGVHQVRRTHASSHMNAQDVKFSSARRTRRASRGVVDHLDANAVTRESARGYSRRPSRPAPVQGGKKSSLFRNLAFLLIAVVAIVAIGFFVTTRVFFGLTGGRMSFGDGSVAQYLTKPVAGQPYYTLVVADLDETNNCDTDVDLVVLARMDEQNKALTCISFPSDLRVSLSDGQNHALADAVYVGGYGELVRAISSLSELEISHIITMNQADIEGLAKDWGGISWNLTEEVDDPAAGSTYIPAGETVLDGKQLTTLLRATNFAEGVTAQGKNHDAFVAKIIQGAAGGSSLGAASSIDGLSHHIKTDWGSKELMSSLKAFGGFDASKATCLQIPCYQSGSASKLFSVSTSSWHSMLDAVKKGIDPALLAAAPTVAINPGSFSITVKNGSGIDGGAGTISSILTNAGFNVAETGNTDQWVYTETLVIYLDDAHLANAQAVANALGTGRVIDGTNHYSFETDVQVILGSDWMPQS